jgi:hypothetical protein
VKGWGVGWLIELGMIDVAQTTMLFIQGMDNLKKAKFRSLLRQVLG